MVEKLGKQCYQYGLKDLFGPITETSTDTSQKKLAETKSNTKAIENLVESNKYVKTLESMYENEVNHSSLIRPIAKLLVPGNKTQFHWLDDLDSDYWNDYKMKREKFSLYDDKLVFRDTGVMFTSKGENHWMINDSDFSKTDSPDAKQISKFLAGMRFDIHAKRKSSGDENLLKNYFNKLAIFASGLKAIFLSENSDDLCVTLKLVIQEKRDGKISNIIIEEMVTIFDNFLEYKFLTPTQHKKKY